MTNAYFNSKWLLQDLDYSNHSPASSCHSGGQPQVYDKIGNIISSNSAVGSVAASTKSLLQPLKSFGNNSSNNQLITAPAIQSSSISIPNTPAKFSESKFILV